jgi:predicted thioesterase
MKDSLQPGVTGEKTIVVTPEMGVKHLGDAGGVLSTPSMVGLMEMTALESMSPHLDPGEQSVGTMVHIWHRASVKTGETVVVRSKILERDRRRVLLEVRVDAGPVRVGDGTHERFVIDVNRYKQG